MIINNSSHQDKEKKKAMKSNSSVRNRLIQVVSVFHFIVKGGYLFASWVFDYKSFTAEDFPVGRCGPVALGFRFKISEEKENKGLLTDSIIDKEEIFKQLRNVIDAFQQSSWNLLTVCRTWARVNILTINFSHFLRSSSRYLPFDSSCLDEMSVIGMYI